MDRQFLQRLVGYYTDAQPYDYPGTAWGRRRHFPDSEPKKNEDGDALERLKNVGT